MKNKKLIIGVVVGIAALVGLYFMFRKKGGAGASAALPAVDSADQAAYEQLYNLLAANIDKQALDSWLGDAAKAIYEGRTADPDRLINGRVTKTGSLLGAWAQAYYPYTNYVFKKDRNLINTEAYAIFFSYKGQSNKL